MCAQLRTAAHTVTVNLCSAFIVSERRGLLEVCMAQDRPTRGPASVKAAAVLQTCLYLAHEAVARLMSYNPYSTYPNAIEVDPVRKVQKWRRMQGPLDSSCTMLSHCTTSIIMNSTSRVVVLCCSTRWSQIRASRRPNVHIRATFPRNICAVQQCVTGIADTRPRLIEKDSTYTRMW